MWELFNEVGGSSTVGFSFATKLVNWKSAGRGNSARHKSNSSFTKNVVRNPHFSLFCGQFFLSFGVTHFLADLTICVPKYWHLRGSERWTFNSVCMSLHLLLLSLCSWSFPRRCQHRQLIRVSTLLRWLHSFVSCSAAQLLKHQQLILKREMLF